MTMERFFAVLTVITAPIGAYLIYVNSRASLLAVSISYGLFAATMLTRSLRERSSFSVALSGSFLVLALFMLAFALYRFLQYAA